VITIAIIWLSDNSASPEGVPGVLHAIGEFLAVGPIVKGIPQDPCAPAAATSRALVEIPA
jgi:hypothetical protein